MDLAIFAVSYPQIMRDFARDYLGGEYFALSLRATCRATRAAIPPPAHMTAEQLMIIASDTNRLDLFSLAIASLGTPHISRETAAHLMRPRANAEILKHVIARVKCPAECALMGANLELWHDLRYSPPSSTQRYNWLAAAIYSGDLECIVESTNQTISQRSEDLNLYMQCKNPRTLACAVAAHVKKTRSHAAIVFAFRAAMNTKSYEACRHLSEWCIENRVVLKTDSYENMNLDDGPCTTQEANKEYALLRALIAQSALQDADKKRLADALILLALWFPPEIAREDARSIRAHCDIIALTPYYERMISRLASHVVDPAIVLEPAELEHTIHTPEYAQLVFHKFARQAQESALPDMNTWPYTRDLAIDPVELVRTRIKKACALHVAAAIHFVRNPITPLDCMPVILRCKRKELENVRYEIRDIIDAHPEVYGKDHH